MCCPDKAWRSYKGTHVSSLQSICNSIMIEPLVENFNLNMRASGMNAFSVNVWLVSERSVSPPLWALTIHKKLIMIRNNVRSAVGQQYKQSCLDQVFHLFNVIPVLNIFCILMHLTREISFLQSLFWIVSCFFCLTEDSWCFFSLGVRGCASIILWMILT